MTAPAFTSETTLGSNVTLCDENQKCRESENFKYFAYTITYSIVFPIGFLSNVVALFVFLRCTPKKSANTIFMTNLAISDVSFSLTLPFRLVYYFRGAQWDFPDWFCRWCVFSFYVNLYTSVLFLTGLSVLRYLAVVHPICSKPMVTVRRANIACFAIWIFVAILSTPFLMSGTLERDNKIRCFEPKNISTWNRIFILNSLGVLLGFVIPFIIILACYGCIIWKLVTGQKFQNQKIKSRQRSLYLIAVVLSTFLLCFLPYHVIRTVHLHARILGKPCEVIEFHLKNLVISLCMAASNSCFNPLLYYFAGETFRTSISRASRRTTHSSFNQSSFYPSFRRQTQSGTLQRTGRQSFIAVSKHSPPCSPDSCHVINKTTPDGCVTEKEMQTV